MMHEHRVRNARVRLRGQRLLLLDHKPARFDKRQHFIEREFQSWYFVMLKVPQQRASVHPDTPNWEYSINDFQVP